MCCTALCFNINAQYEGNGNFTLFQDEFDISGRTWDINTFRESNGIWQAFFNGTGVTHGTSEHQVYQTTQCVFDYEEEMINLVSDYFGPTPMTCDDFTRPTWVDCDLDGYDLHYYSGALESIDKFRYGFFEIRCKLPVHRGAFPAFWLWGGCSENNAGCDDPHYEEIDIFEYTWSIIDSVDNTYSQEDIYNKCYTMGLYYNTTGSSNNLSEECSVARIYSILSEDGTSMNDWNTFGCLWMPDKVEWYINGKMVNSYYNVDSIPNHELYLIANYAIDYHMYKDGIYYDVSDTMRIDYIRAYQPIWDCDKEVLIETQNDFDTYEYGIKKSVIISADNNATPICVAATDDVNIMASEHITIEGPFEISSGANFSLCIQKCPE